MVGCDRRHNSSTLGHLNRERDSQAGKQPMVGAWECWTGDITLFINCGKWDYDNQLLVPFDDILRICRPSFSYSSS